MAWQRLQGNGGILVLGDQDGQIREVEGTLVARRKSELYDGNFLYDLATSTGETLTIAGTAGLNAKLADNKIGFRVRLQFLGWGTTKRGAKFKNIDVAIDIPEVGTVPTPRALTLARGRADGPPLPDEDEGLDDDLPF